MHGIVFWALRVGAGVESCKIVFLRELPIHLIRHFCCRMYHLATAQRVTDRWTERQHYHANRWSAKNLTASNENFTGNVTTMLMKMQITGKTLFRASISFAKSGRSVGCLAQHRVITPYTDCGQRDGRWSSLTSARCDLIYNRAYQV